VETEKRHRVIGGIIGAISGFLFIPVLTILTVIIPIPSTIDLVLLLGFAPAGYCALICIGGAFLAVIGAAIGTGISVLVDRSQS